MKLSYALVILTFILPQPGEAKQRNTRLRTRVRTTNITQMDVACCDYTYIPSSTSLTTCLFVGCLMISSQNLVDTPINERKGKKDKGSNKETSMPTVTPLKVDPTFVPSLSPEFDTCSPAFGDIIFDDVDYAISFDAAKIEIYWYPATFVRSKSVETFECGEPTYHVFLCPQQFDFTGLNFGHSTSAQSIRRWTCTSNLMG